MNRKENQIFTKSVALTSQTSIAMKTQPREANRLMPHRIMTLHVQQYKDLNNNNNHIISGKRLINRNKTM